MTDTTEPITGVRQPRRPSQAALYADSVPLDNATPPLPRPTVGPTQRNDARQDRLYRDSTAVAPPPPADLDDDDLPPAVRPGAAVAKLVRAAGVAVVLLGLVVALVAAAQVANLLAQIAAWPLPLRIAGDVIVGGVLLIVAVLAARLAWRYLRLDATPGVAVPVDRELDHRLAIRRELARQQYHAARGDLAAFLDRYPLDTHTSALRSVGVTPETFDALRAARRTLADAAMTDRAWIEHFDRHVMAPLDAAAAARVRRAMKQVALATAAVPQPALDLLVVLGLTLRLIDELCVVYHVRASRWNSWMILLRLVFNVGAASQVDQLTHTAADHAAGALHDTLVGLGHTALAGGTHLLGRVSGKAATGGVNALLLWRLSRYVRTSLRPMQVMPPAADELADLETGDVDAVGVAAAV